MGSIPDLLGYILSPWQYCSYCVKHLEKLFVSTDYLQTDTVVTQLEAGKKNRRNDNHCEMLGINYERKSSTGNTHRKTSSIK